MKAIIAEAEVNYYKLTFKIIESLKTNNKTCSLCLWFMIYISSGADHTPLTSEDEPQKVIIRIFLFSSASVISDWQTSGSNRGDKMF